ncbi:peroxiredoxin [Fodinibius halophilus]|uniref:Peroxiredoxin n=1 Tax=Fodinibius halophilus TaxID=1736908 RepID=A0A6M1TE87_9BACT|nr:peroxiredoxin [Fodinibius halophilus]NGP89074.1 peroxiredoxin [Fodinibius halophilus]
MSVTAEEGSKAPDFTLQNTEGEQVTLSDFRGDKNVVILFFPLAFSGTCTKELCTTRDNMKLYDSLDAKVIGISIDSFFTLKEFKKAENLNFTLLSDFNKEASKAYGVLNDDYFGMKGVANRASFVVDKQGIIQHREELSDSSNLPDFKVIQKTLAKLN